MGLSYLWLSKNNRPRWFLGACPQVTTGGTVVVQPKNGRVAVVSRRTRYEPPGSENNGGNCQKTKLELGVRASVGWQPTGVSKSPRRFVFTSSRGPASM